MPVLTYDREAAPSIGGQFDVRGSAKARVPQLTIFLPLGVRYELTQTAEGVWIKVIGVVP
jgi:hypothetical protein